MSENYRKALRDAEKETADLMEQRAGIDKRLHQLRASITVLSGLLEEPPAVEDDPTTMEDVGITNAIRFVLREAMATGAGMSPAQIKTRLIEVGFDLTKYANASAVIHNTLKRLFDQKEVIVIGGDGGPVYALAPNPAKDQWLAAAREVIDKMKNMSPEELSAAKVQARNIVDRQLKDMGLRIAERGK